MKIHIFNPEHDIALASNLSNFTAPHAGRQLRHDLGFLPAIWADEGDVIKSFFIKLLDKEIGGQRMFATDDIYYRLGHYFLMAAIPGSSLPSMASKRAPPPVLT